MGTKRKKRPDSYRERNYRRDLNGGTLTSFAVKVRETDLQIFANLDVQKEAEHQAISLRNQLENYIAANPSFLVTLVPLPSDPLAPPIVREMLKAGQAAGVGPMAAVAGVISEYVGTRLLAIKGIDEVVVENGGDIFLRRAKDITVAIFAGESPLSGRVGLKIAAAEMPLGICTSSGTVGHSLSLGRADSVTVVSNSTSLADAVATRLGNEIGSSADINRALGIAATIPGVTGVVIVMDEELGAWGKVELVRI